MCWAVPSTDARFQFHHRLPGIGLRPLWPAWRCQMEHSILLLEHLLMLFWHLQMQSFWVPLSATIRQPLKGNEWIYWKSPLSPSDQLLRSNYVRLVGERYCYLWGALKYSFAIWIDLRPAWEAERTNFLTLSPPIHLLPLPFSMKKQTVRC